MTGLFCAFFAWNNDPTHARSKTVFNNVMATDRQPGSWDGWHLSIIYDPPAMHGGHQDQSGNILNLKPHFLSTSYHQLSFSDMLWIKKPRHLISATGPKWYSNTSRTLCAGRSTPVFLPRHPKDEWEMQREHPTTGLPSQTSNLGPICPSTEAGNNSKERLRERKACKRPHQKTRGVRWTMPKFYTSMQTAAS